MQLFKLIRRRPAVFAMAIAAAIAMVFISEVTYWKSIYSLNAWTATTNAGNDIQRLRQSVLAAQTAQHSFLLTERREFLLPYRQALTDLKATFNALQERHNDDPAATQLLIHLRAVTDDLLGQLALTMDHHDTGQAPTPGGSEVVQMNTIDEISNALLDLQSAHGAARQGELRHSLMLSRIGVALISAVCLIGVLLALRQSFARVRQRTAELTELTRYLQTAREDERHRLARNLHDDLGALLTSAKLDAARIRSRLSGTGPVQESLDLLSNLVATLNSGIDLGRRIIEDLRPSALGNLGLVPTLEIVLGEFVAQSGVQIHRTLEPVALAQNAELMVYRLVQEALTNISKHAHAQNIWVTLGMKAGQVELCVKDNGTGFDTRTKPACAYGLVGMRFRVEAEGGALTVESEPGRGTLIQMRLPPCQGLPATDSVVR